MPKVKVDGIEIEVPQGATVLQACALAGTQISCPARWFVELEG